MTEILLFVIAPYLLGGIPFGLLISRWFCRIDIRSRGSGNIGAANVLRNLGKGAALLTLFLDILKGVFSVLLPILLAGGEPGWCGTAALAAVIGHIFPVYLKFKGGKGVAVTIGAFLLCVPWAMLSSLVCFMIVALPTRIVSLGSIAAALTLPLFTLIFSQYNPFFPFATISSILIIFRHSSNIKNLISGVEPRIGEKN
ncbi:MAG: glycerol-3-phosphate 1-O-acyltransferase PlsY [Acidobacteriota bacterium]